MSPEVELKPAPKGVAGLPDTAQICSCNNVSKGALCAAIEAGCTTVASLKTATRAAKSATKGAAKKKRREPKPAAEASLPAEPVRARPSWKRWALVAFAGLYLADVWLDGVGSSLPGKVLPRERLAR